ncbi:MAG: 50S ribosomal protein L22 [Candidatus Kerfeldbacteria bacterium]
MEVVAKLRYLRTSPKKVRLVIDLIRGLEVTAAEHQLTFLNKGSSLTVLKLLKSAIANATNNFKLSEDNLYIKKITVDQGPTLKRWSARAFGRASEIRKKSSHITIVLDEIKPSTKKTDKDGKVTKKATKKTITKTKDKKTKQPVVGYDDIKQESKFDKEEKDIDTKGENQSKPISTNNKAQDKFSRKLGER